MGFIDKVKGYFLKNNLSQEMATRQYVEKAVSFLNLLPDPDPVLKALGKDIDVYKSLTMDDQVWSNIQQRKSEVTSLLWYIEKGDLKDNEAEVLENILKELDLEEIIKQILNAPLLGFAVLEVVWEIRNSLVLPRKVQEKPQKWFCFDLENNLRLKTKDDPWGREIPDNKFLLVQSDATYENPYGQKALARCFWPVTFKKGGLKFWVTFAEKYGMPFLIGKQPRTATKDDAENLLDKLEQMVQDAIAVIPNDASVEILEGSKTSSASIYKEMCEFFNSSISKALLTQTLTTEIQGKGSYAASQTHAGQLNKLGLSDKRLVEKTINKLLRWICDMNFNVRNYPEFVMEEEEDVNKAQAERDKILTETGIKFTRDYYKKAYNLEDTDFIIEEVSPSPQEGKTPAKGTPPKKGSVLFSELTEDKNEAQLNNEAQLAIDMFIDSVPDAILQAQAESALKPIIAKIQQGEDYSEVMEDLAGLYPKLETRELEKLLEKMIFLSEVWGRLNA